MATYQSMRDFDATPEPAGQVFVNHTGVRRFVVQRHRATRLHYDVRLEVDGVLVSWAVPRGPSLDPARKSLAVKVEDHPYDYGWFEGNIPSGYGKGDVIIWDDGWWEPDPAYPDSADPAAAIAAGELKLVLHGHKVRGRYVLVRTGGKNRDDDSQWLMIHKKDDDAVPGWDPEDHPRSVLSARTNVDVVEGRAGRWPAATADELDALANMGPKGEWSVGGQPVALTNLDKVMMPGRPGAAGQRGAPVTKRDIVAYYTRIAPWLSPYLAGRPINLNRFPDGIDAAKRGFWQKAVPAHAPDFVRRWPNPLADDGKTRDYLLIDGAASLAWVANHAGFEIHPWTSTAAAPQQPSYALVDIDPGPATTWDETLTLARLFHMATDNLGLVARAKVTGKRGIQIWIPVATGYTFRETSDFVEALSRTVGRVVPDLVSWQWAKSERNGKARLDYTQNAINKTLVAPYSVRPAAGAPVSVPITWDELDDPDLAPDRWTIHDIFARLDTIGDPFLALHAVTQSLPPLAG
ncbi:MAG TPA: DNA polymerase ligase N-terminal domain-containing protein [Ilumatobacteraceae bacterium]|nr:DNA polymerase ligase N-terminal domain-containing protein [Ilumatobacteraceae bacterium]